MSQTSVASELSRPLRRSTRINRTVPITVMGVDSQRTPYLEDVSTVAVSSHGCRYESKHDVQENSWVMLELPATENSGQTVSARGLVKWVKVAEDADGVFETAVELEAPGNIWGVDAPPPDWVTLAESRLNRAAAEQKQLTASPSESQPNHAADQDSNTATGLPASENNSSLAIPAERSTGLVAAHFHEQMEKVLLDAADTAVRERARSTMDEVRQGLREEAKRVLTEVSHTQTGPWIEQSLKQLNVASLENAKTLHTAWAARLQSDTRLAIEHVQERTREFDILAQTLSANALDRLQRGLESAMANLARQKEEFQAMLDQSLATSTARIEEARAGFEQQFAMIVRERLDVAREDLEGVIHSSTSAALQGFSASAQEQQALEQARLRVALEPIVEAALGDLKDKAAGSSREFSREIGDRSRAHLELVSASIAEAARSVGKLPSE